MVIIMVMVIIIGVAGELVVVVVIHAAVVVYSILIHSTKQLHPPNHDRSITDATQPRQPHQLPI